MRLIVLRRPESVKRRLLLLHHAGGASSSFAQWRTADMAGTELIAAELPGRGSRLMDAPMTDWRSAVAALDRSISGLIPLPTVIFGHSMGGLLAFELARAADAVNRFRLAHVIVSGHAFPRRSKQRNLHELKEDALLRELRTLDGVAPELLNHHDLLELLMPTLRADLALVERYSYAPMPLIACPLSAWGGTGDPIASTADLWAWEAAAGCRFSVQQFPGGHFYFRNNQEAVCQALYRILQSETNIDP